MADSPDRDDEDEAEEGDDPAGKDGRTWGPERPGAAAGLMALSAAYSPASSAKPAPHVTAASMAIPMPDAGTSPFHRPAFTLSTLLQVAEREFGQLSSSPATLSGSAPVRV